MSEMLLQISDATKIYTQKSFGGQTRQVVALDRFNLKIPKSPATITTIAGESGSGKTTLANVILGFTKISSGRILYEGLDMATANAKQQKQYRRHVQAVFQDQKQLNPPKF